MNPTPEIAPEVRGLLEEIVADPRSTLRLVPRAPLRQWFDRGESLRTADVARTRAERQLIEVHREELARLLREAAKIAYWKAPAYGHLPNNPDGVLQAPLEAEPEWQDRARRYRVTCKGGDTVLLERCLRGVEFDLGHELAMASLGLVPSDSTRLCVAALVPDSQPRTAAILLGQLTRRLSPGEERAKAFLFLGRRLCALEDLEASRDAYLAGSQPEHRPVVGLIYAINMSCALRDSSAALELSESLQGESDESSDIPRALDIIRDWSKRRPQADRRLTADFARELAQDLPPAGRLLCEALL